MKWIKEAKAWLNGEEVEVADHTGKVWTLLTPPDKVSYTYQFHDDCEYRIKPQPQKHYLTVNLNTGETRWATLADTAKGFVFCRGAYGEAYFRMMLPEENV